MLVKFNTLDEFLEELHIECQGEGGVRVIDGQIVRVTVRHQQHREVPHLVHLTVIAGVVINGRLVELCQYCGDIWDGIPDKDTERTRAKVQQLLDRLKEEAAQLGLTVRKGVYEA